MSVEKTWPVNVGATARDLLLQTQATILKKKGIALSMRQVVEMAIRLNHAKIASLPDVDEVDI